MRSRQRTISLLGRFVQPFSLENQPAIQIVLALTGKLRRSVMGRKRSDSGGLHLIHHARSLAKRDLVKSALNALERIRVLRIGALAETRCRRRALLPGLQQSLRFGITGAQFDALRHFGNGPGGILMAHEAHCKIEVIIRIGSICANCLTEERGSILSLAADGNSLVIQDLGKRELAGHCTKSLLCLRIAAEEKQ